MSDILDLSGQVAVVSGAGQGVGKTIAATLAQHGARVVVNDYEADRAEEAAAEIGDHATPFRADVGDFDEVGQMFAHARQTFGPVSIVVNNAGNHGAGKSPDRSTPFWEQTPDEWHRYLHVNQYGVMNMCRHGMADMVPAEFGRIVTIISDAGRVGEINGMEVYSGAKAAAAGFTRAMARLGGRYGITANCIALGATRTPATQAALDNEALAKKVLSHYIVRRFGEPEDAANMALFLSSQASGWITGQTIPVNGGYSLTL